MIDLGVIGNFMTKKVVDMQGFKMQWKSKLYLLMVVDGEPILTNDRMVTYEIVLLEMIIL
jgi:hypothetical protein